MVIGSPASAAEPVKDAVKGDQLRTVGPVPVAVATTVVPASNSADEVKEVPSLWPSSTVKT
jgi:hypothetical protein